jgi:hypothetical protein
MAEQAELAKLAKYSKPSCDMLSQECGDDMALCRACQASNIYARSAVQRPVRCRSWNHMIGSYDVTATATRVCRGAVAACQCSEGRREICGNDN